MGVAIQLHSMSSNGDSNPENHESVDRATPYNQLLGFEQLRAESLVSHCHIAPAAVAPLRSLSSRSLVQSFLCTFPLILSDLITMGLLLLATTTFLRYMVAPFVHPRSHANLIIASLIHILIANIAGLYPAIGVSPAVEFRQIARTAVAAACLFTAMEISADAINWLYYLGELAFITLFVIPSLPTSRFIVRAILRRCPWWGVPVLVYADVANGPDIYHQLKRTQERGLRPIAILLEKKAYYESEKRFAAEKIPTLPVEKAYECAMRFGATWIVVAKSGVTANADASLNGEQPTDIAIQSIPNKILLSTSNGQQIGMWDQNRTVGECSGSLLANSRYCRTTLSLKRFIDFVLASLICLVGSPVLLLIAITIRLTSRGPVLFGQQRIGMGGKPFTAWKFRSMLPNAEQILENCLNENPLFKAEWVQTHKLRHDPRVTWIGKILRRTSLDELPQLWNILRGDMSLVGPRPIVDSVNYDASYIRNYQREYAIYQSVRPGLTGMWQITCRNSGVYDRRIYYDMYYIRNWSLWLDLYIILRTIRTVVMREGSA